MKDYRDEKELDTEEYLAYRLRTLMKEKHITQKEMSERTGIKQSQISAYMTGRSTPRFPALDRMTRVLRVSLDELRHIDVNTEIDHLK